MDIKKIRYFLWYFIVCILIVEAFFDRGSIVRQDILILGLFALIAVTILEIKIYTKK